MGGRPDPPVRIPERLAKAILYCNLDCGAGVLPVAGPPLLRHLPPLFLAPCSPRPPRPLFLQSRPTWTSTSSSSAPVQADTSPPFAPPNSACASPASSASSSAAPAS